MEFTNAQSSTSRFFFWLAVLLAGLVLCFYAFVSIMLFQRGLPVRESGWTSVRRHQKWYVQRVEARGPAEGKLQPGDQILAIDGDTRFSQIDPTLKLQYLASRRSYSVQVMRGASAPEVSLDFSPSQGHANLAWVLSLFTAGLAYYAVGVLMGVVKPGSPVSRLGCVSSLVSSTHMAGLIARPLLPSLVGAQRAVAELASSAPPWHLALGYHFFSRFPAVVPESRIWVFTRIFIYAYCALLFLPRTILNFVAASGEESAIRYHLKHTGWIGLYQEHIFWLEGIFKTFAAVAMCAVLLRNYRLLGTVPDLRRRVKWVAYAAALGIALPAVFTLAMAGLRSRSLPQSGYYPLNIIISNLASAIIPVTLGYAVIKHRVLGVDVVVRRGIQYLLAKNFLRLLFLLPVFAIVLTIASHPDRTVAGIARQRSVYWYGCLLASVTLTLKYRRQLSRWVDRRFFREAYDRDRILLNVIERLKNAESVAEISSMVGTQVYAALHPVCLQVFCRKVGTETLNLTYSTLTDSPEQMPLAAQEALLKVIGQSQAAIQVPPGQPVLPNGSGPWLDQPGTRLIVPVRDSRHLLIGVVLLGEKRSEEPYTASNRNLLHAIAAQMGLALDLVSLRERLENEGKMRSNAVSLLDREVLNLCKECPQCGTCFDHSAQNCPLDGSAVNESLLVERIIDGKYRLDRRIGKGSCGAVYESWDLRLKRTVALKVVAGNLLTGKSSLRRFEREAQAAARLNHRNIVAVYDYGLTRTGGAYLAMELLRGPTWRAELRRMAVIAPPLAAEWLDQLLEGVSTAHQEGVIHRDLKPENVLIASREGGPGLVKILDFGLAKMRLLDLSDSESITLAGAVMGTLGYMSQEQFTAAEVDERTDVFSLGVMTVEALTGRRPFHGRTPGELLKSVLHDPVRLIANGREAKVLNRALQRCLAKDATDRYGSVAEMRRQLIPAVRSCGSVALEPRLEDQTGTISITA